MTAFENDLQANSELMQIVDALNALCSCLGVGKRWQQQCGEDSDDGNDNQQFDESEAVSIMSAHVD